MVLALQYSRVVALRQRPDAGTSPQAPAPGGMVDELDLQPVGSSSPLVQSLRPSQ